MIRRGDTIKIVIPFEYDWDTVKSCCITFKQNGKIVKNVEKVNIYYDINNRCISTVLKQMDTLGFSKVGIPADPSRSLVYIQVRGIFNDTGVTFSSDIIKDRVEDVLNGEVLS